MTEVVWWRGEGEGWCRSWELARREEGRPGIPSAGNDFGLELFVD